MSVVQNAVLRYGYANMQQAGHIDDLKEQIMKHGYISAISDYGLSAIESEMDYIFGMPVKAQRNYGRFDEAYADDIKDLEKNWENVQLLGY